MDRISRIHISSFDFLLKDGLKRMIKYLRPYEFEGPKGELVEISVEFAELANPMRTDGSGAKVYPHQCRRQHMTYSGLFKLHICIKINGLHSGSIEIPCGEFPIMVLSRVCNLSKLHRSEFPQNNEEENEIGGYFIVNGNERVLRLLIMPRRNYPLAIQRPSFKKRGNGYTEHAIIVRSVRDDESVSTMALHWLVNGEPVLAFVVERYQYFVPISILLRALVNRTEFEIFDDIRRGGGESLSLEETAMRILMRLKDQEFNSQSRALTYLGRLFRVYMFVTKQCTDEEAGIVLLNDYISIHLTGFIDKYHLFCLMIRKLHNFVSGQCCTEENDSLMFQEVLLPSTLYMQVLREKIIQLIRSTKDDYGRRSRRGQVQTKLCIQQSLLNRASEVGLVLKYLLSTGNLPPTIRSVIAYQINGQVAGLCVQADNINFLRLAAQFRAVHRGAMFVDIRTTSVRRLLPEAWGFICPVHTPDGTSCGVLNHLAEPVEAVCDTPRQSTVDALAAWLISEKLRPVELSRQLSGSTEQHHALPVLLEGRLIGWCSSLTEASKLAKELRILKVTASTGNQRSLVPYHMEIALVPPTDTGSQYSGLYLFAGGSRLLRPVHNRMIDDGVDRVEWVGTFEQPYMDIAVTKAELMERPPGACCHIEIAPENIFSFVASLTPYPDFNQSPRNMYQCQMAKQTMGHSCYTWSHRSDSKAYRLITPQSPLVRTKTYVKYGLDDYPLGFNAVVAVMSYTAYDMEDAMVINKASYERGFASACIYKSEVVDLTTISKSVSAVRHNRTNKSQTEHCFGIYQNSPPPGLDWDGFPHIGSCLLPGVSPLYAYTHMETEKVTVVRYEGGEQIAYVDSISLNGGWSQATITLRLPRPPDIGDKYSSRHGQKGINSLLVPTEEMPWGVASGVVPDLIFNPHGFPTRMTIGMVIEFLAGKSAAITGNRVDATPFQWAEDSPPFLNYCQQLTDSGFNYWGTEMMMSGCDGRQLEAHIFMGVVYYQRLRHMVADKYQVRSEGRFDPILRQPIKGRKVGGGIRLGEMERDCLLSQGLSFTLQDRLMGSNCDQVWMLACTTCGGLVHTDLAQNVSRGDKSVALQNKFSLRDTGPFDQLNWSCRFCDQQPGQEPSLIDASQKKSQLKLVRVSAALRYLTYELACLNIQTQLALNELT